MSIQWDDQGDDEVVKMDFLGELRVDLNIVPEPNVSVPGIRNERLPAPVPVVSVQDFLVSQKLGGETGG